MGLAEIKGKTYHVDNKLIKHWDKNSLETMKKRNSDRVYLVDGRERSGKSTWAIQQMGYLDPEAFETPESFVSRVCFTADQFHKAVRETKYGVIIFDEAFRGMSSRAALSKVNKEIVQTLMEMGQNNNIVFLVLPSFFRLDMYAAVERSDGLFHISEDSKTNLRKFEGFNRRDKNRIFQTGVRKGWSYNARTFFRGRFGSKFPGGEEYNKAYLKKKRETFEKIKESDPVEEESRRDIMINKGIYEIKEKNGYSFKELGKMFGISDSEAHRKYHKHIKTLENTEKSHILSP